MEADSIQQAIEKATELGIIPAAVKCLPENFDAATVNRLSPRQLQILERIAASQSNQAIADSFSLSISTIKSHVAHIFGKLGVQRRKQATVIGQSFFKP